MKKARKLIFLLILGIVPLVLKADEMEVVKYRWYTKVESNVHYEKDALDVCEYFDLNDYIESDYIYTLEKPEEKSYRTIEMVPYELNVSRNYVSIIRIEYVNNYAPGRKPVTFNEIEIMKKYLLL